VKEVNNPIFFCRIIFQILLIPRRPAPISPEITIMSS